MLVDSHGRGRPLGPIGAVAEKSAPRPRWVGGFQGWTPSRSALGTREPQTRPRAGHDPQGCDPRQGWHAAQGAEVAEGEALDPADGRQR